MPEVSTSPVARAFPQELAAVLEPLHVEHKLPALGAALLGPSGARAVAVVGRRRVDQPAAASVDDKWHLGSNTKPMTATLVAVMVESGAVAWATPLAEIFPDLAGRMAVPYRTVTMQTLLGHRGGTPPDFPGDIWHQLWKPGVAHEQRTWAVQEILARPGSEPGKFVYSNVGYVVVGAALERLTGTTWEDLMAGRVFAPLRMASAGVGPPADGDPLQPWGHTRGWLGGVRPVPPQPRGDNPPAFGPAGRVHCSLNDWCRFLAAHLDRGRGSRPLLSAASFEKLHTRPPDGEYALGWNVLDRQWAGGLALNHGGSNTTFFASAWLAPGRDHGQVVVTNRGDARAARAVDDVHRRLIEQFLR
jgi:CubicO group peptidase (beta-lactamase class C family)